MTGLVAERSPVWARSSGSTVTGLGWAVSILILPQVLALFWLPTPHLLHLGIGLFLAFSGSHFFAHRTLRRIEGRWILPHRAHAGEEVTVGADLTCRQPVGPLSVFVDDGQADPEIARLPGLDPTGARIAWVARFTCRGRTRLPALEVATFRPFGMLLARRVVHDQAEVLVLPTIGRVMPAAVPRLVRFLDTGTAAADAGQDELAHLRAYRPGDSPRRIHWRASARARSLLVCERQTPRARTLSLLLDTSARRLRSRRFERLVSACATLLDHFVAAGWCVRLRGSFAPPAGLEGGRDQLLAALAEVEPEPGAPPDRWLPRHEPCLVLTLDGSWVPPAGVQALRLDPTALDEIMHLPRTVR